ncbi:xylulokinase [Algiphilus sp.]|uniref:xylulokinase n=1 Tax=Algiphilus sp. TaxID=1872431 RepID=UPI003B5189E7
MATVLGIDLGTQSIKVIIYDFDAGAVLAAANAPLDLEQGAGGVAEQQAQWWVRALGQALQQIDKPLRGRVQAVGVSGQQHGFVPLDRSGQVLAGVKLWCDTSTSAQCERIMDAVGGLDACIAATGNPVLPGYTASKIRWFREAHPERYARMRWILLPHDYLNFYLTGEVCMEAGDASGTGCLDIRTRRWSEAILAAIDPDRDLAPCLPEVRSQNQPIGVLRPVVAQALSLPAGIPVSIGGGDNMMSALGTGNVVPGVVTVSLGSSGTIYAYSDVPVVDPKGAIAAFCASTGGWLPLLCTMNCTTSTELMRTLVNADIDAFEQHISTAPEGAGGVITVPFFNGERTPNLPNGKAMIVGLDSRNATPAHLLRSAVEGATFALRSGFQELRKLGLSADELVLTGGGANSGTWRQILADVFDTPVTVYCQNEGAAFGAALQAVAMLEGEGADLQRLTRAHLTRDEGRCCVPTPSAVERYESSFQAYQQAVEQVIGLYGTNPS